MRTLGAAGLICPVVDSLSERGVDKAVDQMGQALQSGEFRHMIITSREAPPPVWQSVLRIQAQPLRREDVPVFVQTYAPQDVKVVTQRIQGLVAAEPLPSPLFLRFAIEQATTGELGSTDAEALVLSYVEALHGTTFDLAANQKVRAASIAADAAVGPDGVPREMTREFLIGFITSNAGNAPFLAASANQEVPPSKVIAWLLEAGVLNDVSRKFAVQFAYDPAAEILASYWRSFRGQARAAE